MTVDPNRSALISEITEALKSLLGRDIKIASVRSAEPTQILVRYVDNAGDLVSAWTVERNLAWSLGGALAMMPVGTVDEAIREGADNGELGENFREVVNVLASIAANVLHRRAVLESVSEDGSELVRTVRQISALGGHWSVLEVNIDGYPGGRIAVSTVPAELS